MNAYFFQWLAVGVIVALAVIFLVRKLRRNPCTNCPLSQTCKKRKERNNG